MPDDGLGRADTERLVEVLREAETRRRQKRFHEIFPDETTTGSDGTVMWARRLYPKHMEFFEASATYREIGLMAANRIGKTEAGAYAAVAHLTGLYPDWWHGRRFKTPIRAWAAGKTNETTRDILQNKFLGDVTGSGVLKTVTGTGMVPGRLLAARPTWKAGVPDLVDTIKVRHASGGVSVLGFKSYQQGRGSFEGTAQHVILLDEEPPADIYGECLIRTATTNGLVMLTFTPLEGMSEVATRFMPGTGDTSK